LFLSAFIFVILLFFFIVSRPPRSPLFPYTTLFRSSLFIRTSLLVLLVLCAENRDGDEFFSLVFASISLFSESISLLLDFSSCKFSSSSFFFFFALFFFFFFIFLFFFFFSFFSFSFVFFTVSSFSSISLFSLSSFIYSSFSFESAASPSS